MGLVAARSFYTDRRMQALLLRLATQLPPPARQLATPGRIATLVQFLMFGTVGTVGFLVDTATVYTLRRSLGLYVAGAAAYIVAATVTWLFNRLWTFRGRGGGPVHQQWARFLGGQSRWLRVEPRHLRLLITFVPLCAEEPVYAVAAGAIAGMFVNFSLSRAMVFR